MFFKGVDLKGVCDGVLDDPDWDPSALGTGPSGQSKTAWAPSGRVHPPTLPQTYAFTVSYNKRQSVF